MSTFTQQPPEVCKHHHFILGNISMSQPSLDMWWDVTNTKHRLFLFLLCLGVALHWHRKKYNYRLNHWQVLVFKTKITRQLLTRHFKNESFMAAAVEKGTWTATVCVSPEHALGGKTVYKMLVFRTWILKEAPHVQPAKPYTLVLRVCIPHQAASVAPGSL